ncbi:FeoA family protein [Bacillaceae bacterium S4-13-58]
MQLYQIPLGQKAKVKDLSGCQLLTQKRLNHLGIFENAEICIQNKLPFGGPCMITCNGQCISIRKETASLIDVEEILCK